VEFVTKVESNFYFIYIYIYVYIYIFYIQMGEGGEKEVESNLLNDDFGCIT
jgi:hypothetical protein